MAEWFEDEDFWTKMFPFLFPEERFERAEEQIEGVLALTGIREGRVLDLCCGPGRHAVLLAKREFRVTGVGRTPFLLEKGNTKGHEPETTCRRQPRRRDRERAKSGNTKERKGEGAKKGERQNAKERKTRAGGRMPEAAWSPRTRGWQPEGPAQEAPGNPRPTWPRSGSTGDAG